MVEEYQEAIARIVNILKTQYAPEKIILFGSLAYGQPTPDSDIDLLIIKETTQERIDRCVEVRKLVYDPARKIPFSPLVYSPQEIERRLTLGDDFIREILEKGKVLYERG